MRSEECMLWRGRRRGMEREKLWIGVWMRENKRERGEQYNFKHFQISNYEREFHKIHINRGKERIVQLLKGCVSSRGATF